MDADGGPIALLDLLLSQRQRGGKGWVELSFEIQRWHSLKDSCMRSHVAGWQQQALLLPTFRNVCSTLPRPGNGRNLSILPCIPYATCVRILQALQLLGGVRRTCRMAGYRPYTDYLGLTLVSGYGTHFQRRRDTF